MLFAAHQLHGVIMGELSVVVEVETATLLLNETKSIFTGTNTHRKFGKMALP
jgi:hypothetical protein